MSEDGEPDAVTGTPDVDAMRVELAVAHRTGVLVTCHPPRRR